MCCTESNLAELEHKEPKIIACLLLSQLNASEHRVIAPELPLFMRIALQGNISNISGALRHIFLIWKYRQRRSRRMHEITGPFTGTKTPAFIAQSKRKNCCNN
jgi:hypothetical protein